MSQSGLHFDHSSNPSAQIPHLLTARIPESDLSINRGIKGLEQRILTCCKNRNASAEPFSMCHVCVLLARLPLDSRRDEVFVRLCQLIEALKRDLQSLPYGPNLSARSMAVDRFSRGVLDARDNLMKLILLVEQPRCYDKYEESDDRVATFKSMRNKCRWGIDDGDEFRDLFSYPESEPTQSSYAPALSRDVSGKAGNGFNCISAFDAYNGLLSCLQGLTYRMYLRFAYPDP